MPIICIDIDEVLAAYIVDLLVWHNSRYGTSLKHADIWNYSLHNIWECDHAEERRRVNEFESDERIMAMKTIPGSVEGVKELAKQHTLVAVTSRQNALRQVTRQWLQLHFGDAFSNVLFTDNDGVGSARFSKSQLCKEAGASLFVDDLHWHCQDCAEKGIPTVMFGDYPYNKDAVHSSIKRVSGWQELLAYIKQIL
jgi:uncharacterized HAD superfamily protein